jgi:hypothetical protein
MSQCPGGRLTADSGPLTRVIRITAPGTVIACQDIRGMVDVEAQNVTIKNSVIESSSGKTGEAANGTAGIKIEDGASAIVDHVKINGDDGVHACVWDQGAREVVNAVDCYGVDDGVWSWADSSYSQTTGDHFVVENSYFHDFTTRTSNGHEDGYQTEGASDGLIRHNTYQMTAGADSAVAIWDSLRDSHNIKVDGNLITAAVSPSTPRTITPETAGRAIRRPRAAFRSPISGSLTMCSAPRPPAAWVNSVSGSTVRAGPITAARRTAGSGTATRCWKPGRTWTRAIRPVTVCPVAENHRSRPGEPGTLT